MLNESEFLGRRITMGRKLTCVKGYTKSSGTKVKGHRRRTPKRK